MIDKELPPEIETVHISINGRYYCTMPRETYDELRQLSSPLDKAIRKELGL